MLSNCPSPERIRFSGKPLGSAHAALQRNVAIQSKPAGAHTPGRRNGVGCPSEFLLPLLRVESSGPGQDGPNGGVPATEWKPSRQNYSIS